MKDIYKHPDHHQQSNKLQNIQVWDTMMYSLHFIQHTYGEKTHNTYPSNFVEYGLGNLQFQLPFSNLLLGRLLGFVWFLLVT